MNYLGRRALLRQEVPINLRSRTRACLAAMQVQPSRAEIVTANRFIAELEDRGYFDYFDRLYCVFLHDEQASRIDLCNPGADTLVKVNSPDFITYQGWKGDGVSKHLTSTWTPTNGTHYQANSAYLGCWTMLDQSSAAYDVCVGSGTLQGLLRSKSGTNAGARSNRTTTDNAPVPTGVGYTAFVRTAVDLFHIARNKAVTAKTTAATGRPTGALNILRVTAGATYSSGLVCGIAVGALPSLDAYYTFVDLLTDYFVRVGVWEEEENGDPPASGDNYFTSRTQYPDNGAITLGSLRVMRTIRPLTSNAETSATYAGFPVTDVNNNLSFYTATDTLNTDWWWAWGIRHNAGYNKKANTISPVIRNTLGKECRAEYTTRVRAEAALKTMMLYVLGASQAEWEAAAAVGGYAPGDIYAHATLAAAPDTYFTDTPTLTTTPYQVMTNKIWLPPKKLSDQSAPRGGVVLDYEVQDGRTPLETFTFLSDLISTIHSYGYQGVLYGNPLNGPTQIYTNLNSTEYMWQLHAMWDFICVLLYANNAESNLTDAWNNQISILRGPAGDKPIDYSKIAMTFGLGINPGTTEADAEAARAIIVEHGIPMLVLWPNNTTIGGAGTRRTNRKTCMLAFGEYPA